MSDRDDIFDLTVRYATAIDSRQYRLLTTVFAEDARIDYGVVGQWTGGAEVARFMEAAHVGAAHTIHRMTNQAISIDTDTATIRTYVDALILMEDGSGANPVGYYDDHAVRTPDGWRIDRRTYTSVRLAAVPGAHG
ncbi:MULTISPECIES: nuclear transport factor 2 family protein [unclassified Mycobacterium]|uniref:nuclear transport factor 2 family protein n=1 Tax=unclassified Mycobacterium TaxID=2642494 RepID=UPI000801C2F6|nr:MULTISPECIES: nuclear transport factor 2 family protein [unclassified Mycobacterium]OBG69029.1 polyketide cyclase [Mycobacterium sp. E188]OBG82938.1 polyketide cyclase [Mycobacterium sp. E3305]OBH33497.1 polyketide cyclase [Mycobacterium sp. E183]